MASILDRIRQNVERKGGKKGNLFYLKKDTKKKVRLLRDMDDAVEIVIHDQYPGKTVPCLKHYGASECPFCDDPAFRTRSNFGWPVWSYDDDNGSVKVMLYKANDKTPVKAFLDNFEEFETVTDADYIVKRTGEGFDTMYGVIRSREGDLPKDILKAIKEAGGVWDDKKILSIVGDAFDVEDELKAIGFEIEDEEEEKPKKKKKAASEEEKPAKKKKKAEPEPEPEDEDDDFDDDDEDDE